MLMDPNPSQQHAGLHHAVGILVGQFGSHLSIKNFLLTWVSVLMIRHYLWNPIRGWVVLLSKKLNSGDPSSIPSPEVNVINKCGRHLIDQISDWPNLHGFTKGVRFVCLNRYVQVDRKPFGQSEIWSIRVLQKTKNKHFFTSSDCLAYLDGKNSRVLL